MRLPKTQHNVLTEGVDLSKDARRWWKLPQVDGKNCRDRQPWGGVTDPDRCECVGPCQYDQQQNEDS